MNSCACPPVSGTVQQRKSYWDKVTKTMLADKFQQYYCYEKFGKPWWETGLCYIISDNAWDCIDACLLDNGSVPEQEQALIDVLLIVQEMEQKTTEGWPLVEVTSDFRNNLFRQMQGAAAGMATTLTSIINTVQDLKKNELVRGAGMVTDLDSADLPLVTSATTDSKMPLGQSYLNLSQSNVYTQLNNMEKFVINVLEYYKQASLIDPNLSLGESQRLHYSMLYSNTFGSLSKYSQSVYFNKKYDTHVVSLPDRSAMSAVWDSVILVDWSHQDYNFRQSSTQKFDNYIFTQDGSDSRRYIIQTPYYQSDQSLSASLIVDLDASSLDMVDSDGSFVDMSDLVTTPDASCHDGGTSFPISINHKYFDNEGLSGEQINKTLCGHTSVFSLIFNEVSKNNQQTTAGLRLMQTVVTPPTADPILSRFKLLNTTNVSSLFSYSRETEEKNMTLLFSFKHSHKRYAILYNSQCVNFIRQSYPGIRGTNSDISTNFLLLRVNPTVYGFRINPLLQKYATRRGIVWMVPVPQMQTKPSLMNPAPVSYQGYNTLPFPPPLLEEILYADEMRTEPRIALPVNGTGIGSRCSSSSDNQVGFCVEDALFDEDELKKLRLVSSYTDPSNGEMQGVLVIDSP